MTADARNPAVSALCCMGVGHDGLAHPLPTEEVSRAHRAWRCIGAALAVSVVLSGCGASRSAAEREPVKYVRSVTQVLARQPLRVGEEFAIAALRYRFSGRAYSRLGVRFEERGGKGGGPPSGWSGGPALGGHAGPVAAINVHRGCVGDRDVAVAYGLLRTPADDVSVRRGGTERTFRKVLIPATFEPGGVLVYAELPSGASEVVVRTPARAVVMDESLPNRSALCASQ
jgi:hypothetical protein